MIYNLLSFIVLIASIKLFQMNVGSLSLLRLNMINWIFYYNLIIQSFISSLLTINHLDNHYLISKVSEEARFRGWITIQYVMFMLPLAMLLVNKITGYSAKNKFKRYLKTKITFKNIKSENYLRQFLYFLSFISFGAVIYTFLNLKEIPLLALFNNRSAIELSFLRQEVSRNFTGNEYIRNILAIGMTPLLTYISFAYYFTTRNKKDFYWFISLLVASLLILTYDLSKSPIINFFIGFIFCYVLLKGKISKKSFSIALILGLILLLFTYTSITKIDDYHTLFSYNKGLLGRILLSQSAGIYLSYQYFPNNHEHIGFSSISRYLSSLFGQNFEPRSARTIMTIVNSKGVENGTAGVVNSLFVAEAWANWGFYGVLISPIIVGMVIQIIFLFFLTHKKTPFMVGLFTYISIKLPVTGGFNDFIYNAVMFSIIIILFVTYLIAKSVKKERQKNYANNISSSIAA